jgi:hypothetical protein
VGGDVEEAQELAVEAPAGGDDSAQGREAYLRAAYP